MKTVIGIDIGGTNFRIGAVDEQGDVHGFRKIPVRTVFRTEDPMEDLIGYLKDFISELKDSEPGIEDNSSIGTSDKCSANIESGLPDAIAIGFPATLDRDRQTVLQAPNIAFMEHLPVVKALTDAFQIPVFIERDVTMALFFDSRKYQLPKEGMVCGFYFGTGIGNAISINGLPLFGKNGTAGELGHIPVDGNEEECGCGNVGCMEPLAGGKYLATLCRTTFTDTSVGDIFLTHGDDPLILQFIDRMAMAAATEINILDPDYILVGGGVPLMKGFPKDLLVERIKFHARKPFPAESLDIIFTGDEEDKCVIGAAAYARARLQ